MIVENSIIQIKVKLNLLKQVKARLGHLKYIQRL